MTGGGEALPALAAEARAAGAGAAAHFAFGSALLDAGRIDEAIVALRRAVRKAPRDARAVRVLAAALERAGRADLAAAAYARACAAMPARPGLALAHAALSWRSGRRRQALRACAAAFCGPLRIALPRAGPDPARDEAAALSQQASSAFAAVDKPRALALARDSLARDAGDTDALVVAASVLAEQGRAEEGLALAQQAVAAEPYVPEYQIALANCERLCGFASVAIERLQRVTAIDPGLGAGHANLARVLFEQERFAEAEAAARRALEIDPARPGFLAALSNALVALGRHDESARLVRDSIATHGEHATRLLSLSQCLRAQGQLDAAGAALERAVALDPAHVEALLTLGLFRFTVQRDYAGAREAYEAAARADPEEPGARLNQALLRMSQGDYGRESWDLYEWRKRMLKRMPFFQRIPLPAWEGEPLQGRGLLVFAEQGIGDEIMFASMLPDAARLAGRCTLACDPRLAPLFARSFPGVRCVPWERTSVAPGDALLEGMDVCAAAGSLGRYLRAAPEAFDRAGPFLRADPVRVRAWRARLAAIGPPPYVGLGWRGGVHETARNRRSIDAGELKAGLARVPATWISLQRDASPDELEAARAPGHLRLAHLPETIADVDDAAALVAALDAVVTVCSWLVHIAGGLGRPAFVLAPLVPDFRYGLAGRGMRWYASVRVYRQQTYAMWDAPLDDLRRDLAELRGGDSRDPISFALR